MKGKWLPFPEDHPDAHGFYTYEVMCSECGNPQDCPSQFCEKCKTIMEGEYKMNFLQKYFYNTTTFKCTECKYIWRISWWQWLWTMKFDITRHRYVKCPRCSVRHWVQAEKVV